MKKQATILFILCICSFGLQAQRRIRQLDEDEAKKQEQMKAYERGNKMFDPNKLVYGGNVGMSFSTNGSFVLAQPMVGYKVREKTILGGGFTYIYSSFTVLTKKYSTSAYGPLLFARQNILGQVFAYTEYQPLNLDVYNATTRSVDREWLNQLFVGGGLGTSGAQLYILYDVLYNENRNYNGSPLFIRIGFMF